MSFVLSTIKAPELRNLGRFFIKGDFQDIGQHKAYFKGEILGLSCHEALQKVTKTGIGAVKEFRGAYFLVCFKSGPGNVYIANDHMGAEPLFYYHRSPDPDFIFSDDFWEIVNILEPIPLIELN